MKLTKEKIRKIINEEMHRVMNEWSAGLLDSSQSSSIGPGEYVEIMISDDGYETSVSKVDPSSYVNTKSPYTSFKCLAKIEIVAEGYEEPEDESWAGRGAGSWEI